MKPVDPSGLHAIHRQWPIPRRPWIIHMSWHDLLFQHWPVPASSLRPLVPRDLEIEEFDGSAWLGIVPFSMTARPRGFHARLASHFPEVNVRTYVRHRDKPGVWFFSLDAADRLTVWGARRFFHLPYYHAAMSSTLSGETVHYRSRRIENPDVQLQCAYRPTSPPQVSSKGTLEYWLTERYCLFSASRDNQIFCGEIHHPPWELQLAEAENETNTLAGPLGLSLTPKPELLHFAKRQDVVAWLVAATIG